MSENNNNNNCYNIDIADILRVCGIEYKEKGKFFIISCLNPAHIDENPSMRLYADSGIAHCFSCGYNIHISQIYKKYIGKDLDLRKYMYDFHKVKTKKVKEKIVGDIKITGELQSIFNNNLAYQYAIRKGLSKEFIEFFNVKAIKVGTMQIDGFKEIKLFNRLIFPIKENNKLISIEARDYTEKSAKKIIYPDGSSVSTLFGIDHLDYNKPLIVVEGIKSLWKLWTIDHNSTSNFNNLVKERQKELYLKFPEITLFIDHDEAGEKLVDQFNEFYDKPLYIVRPEKYGDDPNDLTIDEQKRLLDKRQLLEDWDMNQYNCFKGLDYRWR